MAAFAFVDGYVAINGVDRSSTIRSVAAHVEAAELNTTDMASSGWMKVIAGLKSGNVQLGFVQDMAASAIDSVMWPLFATVVTFEVRASNAAVGTSNPKYTGSFLVKEWTPLNGNVGDLAVVAVTFPTSGVITRATS